MFWLAAAACAVAEGAIIISSLRPLRRAQGMKAVREAMWAVIPALALAWLLAATWTEVKRGSAHEQQMNMPMTASGA